MKVSWRLLVLALVLGACRDRTGIGALPDQVEATVAPAPAPPGNRTDEPVALTTDMEAPERWSSGEPSYAALSGYRWSSCIFSAVVSKEGSLEDLELVKPKECAPEATKAHLDYLKTWTFRPAMLEGRPVAVQYNLLIHHCPCYRPADAVTE